MSLETATYINQLDAANPLGSDPIASGDDHIRLIKSTIKATFPNITGPVTATQAQLNAVFPPGGIVIWSGAANAIPSGWLLCDGTNGTPNLRDRFVIGAGSTYSVGNTGGAASVTLSTSQLPSHTHSVTASGTTAADGSHTHNGTVANGGAHTHTYKTIGNVNSGLVGNAYTNTDWGWHTTGNPFGSAEGAHGHSMTIDAVGAHTHTVSVSGTSGGTGSGASVDIRNPYYALCYIMKA